MTYIYRKETNSIKQKATMARPVKVVLGSDSATHKDSLEIFESITNNYNQHIADLKEYQCSDNAKELWSDKQELIQGVDFKLHSESFPYSNELSPFEVKGFTVSHFAIPIHPVVVDEDKLWNEVGAMFHGSDNFQCYPEFLQKLKDKYTIKTKGS